MEIGNKNENIIVNVLSKDKCLKIAKIVYHGENKTDDELLSYLPDSVFGMSCDFIAIEAGCVSAREPGGLVWSIPFYFIEYAQVSGEEE